MLEIRIPSPVAPPPLEPTTPIKPSEAIRLGCLVAPRQMFNDLSDGKGATCALSALHDGGSRLSDLYSVRVVCPECGNKEANGAFALIHLNDDHRWSRERIADWLASIGL